MRTYKLHVNILLANVIILYVNTTLYVDIILLACERQKYTTIRVKQLLGFLFRLAPGLQLSGHK